MSFPVIQVVIVLLAALISFVVYRLYGRKFSRKHNELILKKNIALLRDERLVNVSNPGFRKKRNNLVKKTKVDEDISDEWIAKKSRQMKMPAGELLLAVKIKNSVQ